MAEIDRLLNNMAAKGVERAVLCSGQPMLLFRDGQVTQGATLELARLMTLAREIVPTTDCSHLTNKYETQSP